MPETCGPKGCEIKAAEIKNTKLDEMRRELANVIQEEIAMGTSEDEAKEMVGWSDADPAFAGFNWKDFTGEMGVIRRMDLLEKPRFMEPLGELPIGRTRFPEVPRMESRSFDVPEATLKPSLPRLSDLLKPFVKVDAEEYVEAEQRRKKRQQMVDAQDAFDFSSLSEK